jgi:natural product precursor
MKKLKVSLSLNKEVIDQLDKVELSQIKGGYDVITTLWGSNCYNTDPHRHKCCEGDPTTFDVACMSYTSVNDTTPGSCCAC